MKELLFSIKKSDLIRQTFRCSGNGGQNVNKVETGVRFIHEPSGARAECCEERKQHQNEKKAFLKLSKDPILIKWIHQEAARKIGTNKEIDLDEIERKVDEMMKPENLEIEYLNLKEKIKKSGYKERSEERKRKSFDRETII